MAEYGAPVNNKIPLQEKKKIDNKGFLEQLLTIQIGPTEIPPRKLKVPQNDLLVFFRQLSVILKSGVPLAQGLELLSENMTNKDFSKCVVDISRKLSAGEELSLSLKCYPKVFAPITIGLIEAGEAGGILSGVLERVALLIEEQAKIRGQITGALIYPLIVLALALTVGLALLIFIVPTFKDLFDDLGAELPALTNFMLTLSNIVTSPGFLIGAPVLILVTAYLIRGYYVTSQGRKVIDSLILKVPLFGLLITRSEMASLCDTLSTLVNSGIPLVEGLERCISASSNQIIKDAIQKSINLVTQGQDLSYSFKESKIIPKLVTAMIRIGEETGQLPFMLENLSNFYKREVEETVSALTKAMEPAVIFVVAGIVGTIVVALYLPMFSLIGAMG